jgi:RNA polymerase sigma-70 factor (ECF subfamily)
MRLPTYGALSDVPVDEFQTDLVSLMPYLRAFSRVLCRHRDLADDLTQDALVKAWRSRDQFKVGTNLKAWLFTILRHEFYSHRRRASLEMAWDQVKGDGIEAAPDPQFWSSSLSDAAHALRALSDNQREALILIAVGGLSYDDAAGICKARVGTMKSRVARGRATLARNLDSPKGRKRCRSVDQDGGFNDILAQLSALMPVGAYSTAYA